jgi:hypothetical protein
MAGVSEGDYAADWTQNTAKSRVTDLETARDNCQAQLKPMNPAKW